MEKISEQHLRIAKVLKLKKKILSEIEGFSNYLKEGLKEVCCDDKLFSEFFEKAAIEEVKLISLKKFVNDPSSFMKIIMKDPAHDAIIYGLSDKHLNMFIDDNFKFVQNFLAKTAHIEICDMLIDYLSDGFFEFNFVNAFEEVLYDKKIREESNVVVP